MWSGQLARYLLGNSRARCAECHRPPIREKFTRSRWIGDLYSGLACGDTLVPKPRHPLVACCSDNLCEGIAGKTLCANAPSQSIVHEDRRFKASFFLCEINCLDQTCGLNGLNRPNPSSLT